MTCFSERDLNYEHRKVAYDDPLDPIQRKELEDFTEVTFFANTAWTVLGLVKALQSFMFLQLVFFVVDYGV